MSSTPAKLTPAMKQYYEMKAQYADTILFFRMGDFYEMFDEDAKIASKELGLTLTSRNKNANQPTPLAGIPYHAANKYIAQLTKKGYKVTISEQVSDPALPGIVQRAVTNVVTPGTTLQSEVLDAKDYNYLATISGNSDTFGLSLLDLSTGTWHVTECRSYESVMDELLLKTPKEVLVDDTFLHKGECLRTLKQHNIFAQEYNSTEEPEVLLKEHFQIQSLSVFGLEKNTIAQQAAALSLSYIYNTQKTKPQYLHPPRYYNREGKMILDSGVIRNLELFATSRDGEKKGSLLSILDNTMTGAGGRLLRDWMLAPELDLETIEQRLNGVEFCYRDTELRKGIRSSLSQISDIERLLARLSLGRGNARDMLAIAHSLESIGQIQTVLHKESPLPTILQNALSVFTNPVCREISQLISQAISPEAGVEIMSGGIILEGFDKQVDELRGIKQKAKEWMMEYQQKEQVETGISQMKVKYTSVFGYFLEIPKSQEQKVPSHYVRKQTLVGAERYITEELKMFEEKVLSSEEKVSAREYEIFLQVRDSVLAKLHILQKVATQYSTVDVIASFAELAYLHSYVRPTFTLDRSTRIQEGRHPVVAALLQEKKETYVPNDIRFTQNTEEFLLITGPNMAGKSTYLRQVALIAFLGQIGSFVPATSALLPIYDRIFTRVGASDNMSRGESTFMVEMQEASYILHNATSRSLVILDEIGRGTSTYDGLSIAWAIVSYIHDHLQSHTLFATHYHELIDVVDNLSRAKNYSVAIAESESGVIFLHKIVGGGASESYGIEVAKLAGVPSAILKEAKKHLLDLERNDSKAPETLQDSLFAIVEPEPDPTVENVITELKQIKVESMTPLEALTVLAELNRKVNK